MSENDSNQTLVLDTGAFLSLPESFFLSANLTGQRLYSTERVIAEVRDPAARAKLANLDQSHFDIREPSRESIAHVVQFSKQTGDYTSLSLTDLQILALTWMLEVEKNGPQYVRDAPPEIRARPTKAKKKAALQPTTQETGAAAQTVTVSPDERKTKAQKRRARRKAAANAQSSGTCGEDAPRDGKPSESRGLTQTVEQDEEWETNSKPRTSSGPQSRQVLKPTTVQPELETQMSADAFEDDGVGWINEDNLDESMAQDVGSLLANKTPASRKMVGCMTTDFAMQNVLLQMGLQLVSPDNGVRVVQEIRRFILRCEACFKITRQLDKVFCPHCGNHSLAKIPHTVDKDGCVNIRFDPRRQPKLRGTKYSIPLPKGGRNNTDLILAEDQMLMRSTRQRKKDVDVLDPSVSYNAGAKYNPQRNLVVGYGRRNPNQVGRRTGSKAKN